MALSSSLISQLVKTTNDSSSSSTTSTTVYGTARKVSGSWYVLVDGSEQLVPMTSTATVSDGDRVIMVIENHTATVTGNLTDQSASSKAYTSLSGYVDDLNNTIITMDNYLTVLQSTISITDTTLTLDEAVIKITDGEVIIQGISIDSLNDTINSQDNKITAIENDISLLTSVISIDDSTVTFDGVNVSALNDTVTSQGNSITALNNVITITDDTVTIKNVDIVALNDTVNSQGDTITSLNNTVTAQENTITAINNTIDIYDSSFQIIDGVVTGIKGVDTDWITTNELETDHAVIESLNTTYANIDFSNIGQAAIEYFYAKSGIIEDLVIGDTTVTGKLVGITITGDLIEANTIVADKLVVLGEDGLYYALNFNGETVETEQTDYNSINGNLITANTITASKINVDDLVAFDATIGGFNITDSSIYSGVKSSIDNTTRGIYMDDDGQICFGDDISYIKYYYDETGQTYKLSISAGSISLGTSGKSVEESIDELTATAEEAYEAAMAAQESVENLSIGGRNYALLSGNYTENGETGWQYDSDSAGEYIDISLADGYTRITCLQTGGEEYYAVISLSEQIDVEETYTLSIKVRRSTSTDLAIYRRGSNTDGDVENVVLTTIASDDFVDEEWVTNVFTFTLGSSVSGAYDALAISAAAFDAVDDWIDISWLKLEKGNTSTDWTPAPEDVDNALDDVEESASENITDLNTNVSARLEMLEGSIETISNSLSNLVVDENGVSLVEQTDEGWVFSMANTLQSLANATDSITSLMDSIEEQGGDITAIKETLTGLAELNSYVKVTTSGDEPCVELGNNSTFRVLITNTAINFMDGDNVIAYINGDSLKITKADVQEEFRVGNFVMKERSNGNVGLIYVND